MDSLIGSGFALEGEIRSEGDLEICGMVRGKVSTTGSLRVGPGADVEADIAAAHAELLGWVIGSVVAGKVVLGRPAEECRSQAASRIGARTVAIGRMLSTADLEIDGRVEGSVRCAGTLVLGPAGLLRADVHGRIVRLAGAVHGNVTATESVVLLPGCRMVGDLQAPRISLSEGAAIRGRVEMGAEVAAQAAEPAEAAGETVEAPAVDEAPVAGPEAASAELQLYEPAASEPEPAEPIARAEPVEPPAQQAIEVVALEAEAPAAEFESPAAQPASDAATPAAEAPQQPTGAVPPPMPASALLLVRQPRLVLKR